MQHILTLLANVLSISHIASSTDGVECTFSGIDGSSTTVSGAVQVDVGPPQTQVSGTCSLITTKRRRSNDVSIKFIGAADAEFSQSFPTDGRLIAISKSYLI